MKFSEIMILQGGGSKMAFYVIFQQLFYILTLEMTLKLKTQGCIHSQILLHPMTNLSIINSLH